MPTTYYVSAAFGLDSNPGSIGAPFQTIQHGLSVLASGDTLDIRTGTYSTYIFESHFGATGTAWTAGNFITVRGHAGETVTLTVGTGGNIVRFLNSSIHHVLLDNLILDGHDAGGGAGTGAVVYLEGSTHHLHFNNVEIKDGEGVGILGGGDSHEFRDLNVHNNGRSGVLDGIYKHNNGAYFSNLTNSLIVGGDYWDNECIGLRVGSSGVTNADGNVIDGVRAYLNGGGIGLGGASPCDSIGAGILLADTNNTVKNSISWGNTAGYVFYGLSGKTASGLKAFNNLAFDNDGPGFEVNSTLVHSAQLINNISFNNGTPILDNGSGTVKSNNLFTDPLFTDSATHDFTLQAGSPAIDAGMTLAEVPDDFLGNARPAGAFYDIGPYEYGGTGGGGGTTGGGGGSGTTVPVLAFLTPTGGIAYRYAFDGTLLDTDTFDSSPWATGVNVAVLPNGVFMTDDMATQVRVFAQPFTGTPLGSNTHGTAFMPYGPKASLTKFYYIRTEFTGSPQRYVTTVYEVLDDGSAGSSWTLPAANIVVSGQTTNAELDTLIIGWAVSADGNTLYYAARNRDLNRKGDGEDYKLRRYNLAGSAPISDLVTDATNGPFNMIGLSDGNLVVIMGTGIRVYNPSGSVVYGPYSSPNTSGFALHDSATEIWCWNDPTDVELMDLTDGSITESLTAPYSRAGLGETFFLTTSEVTVETPTPTVHPVPIPTPSAPKAPCDPLSDVGSGGTGAAGCNTGGEGYTPDYDTGDDGGGVDEGVDHADPPAGELLTNKRGVVIWIDYIHIDVDYVYHTHSRSFTELGHLSTYQNGRKTEGLMSIGDIEYGLSNEQGGLEAATVDIQYADQVDRLFRNMLETEDLELDEIRVKAVTPEGAIAGTAPRILSRSVVQKVVLNSPMGVSITGVDELFADYGPFGPDSKFPSRKFGDIEAIAEVAPADVQAQVFPFLYGEKSDKDPTTGLPKGLIPGYYCGKFDLGDITPGTPDTIGRTLAQVVADLQTSVDAGTTDADWGFIIGSTDAGILEARGTVPGDFLELASIVGYSDLYALLAYGTTAPPASDEWGLIAFGIGEWFRNIQLFGSDLGGGGASTTPDRILLDPDSRGDILAPDFIWPFANRYIEFVNMDGTTYWVWGIWVRGPLLDDHISGKVNITLNAIGYMGNGGLPIYDVEIAKQHFIENFLINSYTSGEWADETNGASPIWEDGTFKVNSSSFRRTQAIFADGLGGRGITVNWYGNVARNVSSWFSELNSSTDSKLGFNSDGQIIDYAIDLDEDPTDWPLIEHPVRIFGPITRLSSQERENVVVGSCDWDPDANKYRIGPVTKLDQDAIFRYKWNRRLGNEIKSTILGNQDQLEWVLNRRLDRLKNGSTTLDVQGDIGLLDYEVGTGILFSSIEGPGAAGFAGHPFIILRKNLSIDTRLTTLTLWDVKDLLTATRELVAPRELMAPRKRPRAKPQKLSKAA